MTKRVSRSAAVAIALPSLLAGALLGLLLRSRATEPEAPPPRPAAAASRPAETEPAPARVAAPTPADAPTATAKGSPATSTRTGKFEGAWRDLREWLRPFDLKSMAGRHRVPPAELQERSG